MADDPLKRLARLLGGIALSRGRLPHQILGQLMISNVTSIEMAGASVAIAATRGQASTLAQTAVRTAAPSLAVKGIARRMEKRLNRLAERTQRREQDLGALLERVRGEERSQNKRIEELGQRQQHLDARSRELDVRDTELQTVLDGRAEELEARSTILDAQEEKLANKQADLREDEADLRDRRRLLLEEAARGRADTEEEIERLRAEIEMLRGR